MLNQQTCVLILVHYVPGRPAPGPVGVWNGGHHISDVCKQTVESRWALLQGVRQTRREAYADGRTSEPAAYRIQLGKHREWAGCLERIAGLDVVLPRVA